MKAKFLKSGILIVVIAITSAASTFAGIKIRQEINMNGNYITNLAIPTKPDHAVPKGYADYMFDVSLAKLPKPGNGELDTNETGVSWPNPRFIDNGDGTVTDNLTDLMWTQDGSPRYDCLWSTAVVWCRAYVYAGHADWRLPNINEVSSLLNFAQGSPATWLNSSATPFGGVEARYYWSSSFALYSGSAWRVNMGNGFVYDRATATTHSVWPVRAGR